MTATTWLITGANRGCGLAYVKLLLAQQSTTVVAAVRKPPLSEGLQSMQQAHGDRLKVVSLEATSAESVEAAAAEVGRDIGALDYIVNNAGIIGTGELDFGVATEDQAAEPLESIERCFSVNTLGPLLVTRAFLPLLLKGNKKTVVNISSGSGVVTWRQQAAAASEPAPIVFKHGIGYAMSKAALQMQTAALGAQLKEHGLIFISMDPGWMDTGLGRQGGKICDLFKLRGDPPSAEDSAQGQIEVISGLTPADNGKFLNFHGEPNPF
ncbi:hypothetical protein WJX73_002157 [Symbiochloris irregularis]|uniref:NAD(P)-binding protein n=1 Tax=Symbiochloris irregularis TaxID=706552 RepID=A0AAW1P0P9_9CHLO